MIKRDEIKSTLRKMALMLNECEMNDWSESLLSLIYYIDDDYDEAIYKILSLYGGVGSLNDIVLYKDGKLLNDENDVFNELSSHLYELCRFH